MALVSAVLTLLLIRGRDFEAGAARGGALAQPNAEAAPGSPATARV